MWKPHNSTAGALALLVSGCTSAGANAICERTEVPALNLAAALVEDGGDKSVSTGRTLIAIIDAGCGR